jgi:hypothetical protein
MILVMLVRQSGKSQFMLSAAVSELLTMPNAYVLYVATSEKQAQAVYERKLRAPMVTASSASNSRRYTGPHTAH